MAETTVNAIELGIRSTEEKAGSPLLLPSGFLLVIVQSVT